MGKGRYRKEGGVEQGVDGRGRYRKGWGGGGGGEGGQGVVSLQQQLAFTSVSFIKR